MRPRIAMAIISSSDGNIVRRETIEEIQLANRRATFEKNRKKLNVGIIGHGKPMPASLVLFNMGIANAIAQFKQSKRCS